MKPSFCCIVQSKTVINLNIILKENFFNKAFNCFLVTFQCIQNLSSVETLCKRGSWLCFCLFFVAKQRIYTCRKGGTKINVVWQCQANLDYAKEIALARRPYYSCMETIIHV